MFARIRRFGWAARLAVAALAFQAIVLAVQTPMEVARGLPPEHCERADASGGHHKAPAQTAGDCQICLGMQVAGHGVAPTAPVLPLPPLAPSIARVAIAIEAPPTQPQTPQNPRAPPASI
ncbi:MAG: DUF2946 domain-containing protein [Alphaproteobacteria bacterium]|nr:DUF2946 domain-containing protein [Alphaproteobacteria bacterium]